MLRLFQRRSNFTCRTSHELRFDLWDTGVLLHSTNVRATSSHNTGQCNHVHALLWWKPLRSQGTDTC